MHTLGEFSGKLEAILTLSGLQPYIFNVALINIFKHKVQVFHFFLGGGTHATAPKVREPLIGAGSPLPHIGPACQTWIGRFGSSIFTH